MAGKPSSGKPPPLTPATSTPYQVRHRRNFSGAFTCGQTLAICARNILPLLVLAAVVFTPVIAFQFYSQAQLQEDLEDGRGDWRARDHAFAQYGTRATATEVLKRAFMFILQGLVAFLVFRQMQGRRARFTESVGNGLTRLPQVLAVAIWPMIAVFSLAVLPVWIESLRPDYELNAIRLLLLVPAYIVYIMLLVCVQAAVVEGTGIADSLRRSVALTRGRRMSIFAGWMLLLLVQGVLALGLFLVFRDVRPKSVYGVSLYFVGLLTLVIGMMDAVYASVAYHNLRYDKEGTGIEEIAKVFE